MSEPTSPSGADRGWRARTPQVLGAALAVTFVVAAIWSSRGGPRLDLLIGPHSPACGDCSFTRGDRMAASTVSSQTADSIALALSDLPVGFALEDDIELTPESMTSDAEERKTLTDHGFLFGRDRTFRRRSTHGSVEVRSHVTIYANAAGASWAENANARDVRPSTSGGRVIYPLDDVTIGDESRFIVIEDPGEPDLIWAGVVFRIGNISTTISVSANRLDLDGPGLVRLAYAQLGRALRP